MLYEYVLLGSLLLLSVICDLRYHRIPNLLLLPFFLVRFLLPFCIDGSPFPNFDTVFSFLLPVILLYILFYIRALGAGDIKLLAVIGCYTGGRILMILVFSMIIGAIYGILLTIFQGSFKQRWNSFIRYVVSVYRTGKLSSYSTFQSAKTDQISFSVAIALAYSLEVLLRFQGISFFRSI